MLSRIFHVGILLLSFYWTLEAKLHYAVIFPSEIRALNSQLACLHVQGASGETTVQLIISTGDGNITLIKKSFEQDSLFSCVPFQIPSPSQENEEICVVDLSIVTPLETVSKQSKVILKKQRSSFFIQTDKPVYKPGQTVKFRIICLKENLLPKKKEIPLIEVQDPANNRIGQWLNVTLNEGISEFSLPLSPEPTLGEYKIWVKGKASSFTVEEYVLPKFEIRLDFPILVTFNCETIPAKVCGKYTFGKPIQGTYSIKVCREQFMTYQTRIQGLPYVCTELTGRLDKSGCSSGELKSEIFELTKTGFHRLLKAIAIVTEDGTGVELTANSIATITMVLEKVSFVDPDKTYKPGMAYSGTVKVQDGVDSPVPDKQIYLFVENRGHSEKLTLVSDKNGFASFKLENTTFWEGQIRLVAKTTEKESKREFGIVLPERSNAYLQLSSFYSRSKSFLKLHSLTDILPCKGQKEVQLEYIIKRTELEAETKKLDFHYLMVSKGSLLESGTLEIPVTSDGEDITGTTSFNLHLMPDVAPNLRVLIYVLLPKGEIVADSAKFTVQRCFNNKVSVRFTPDEVLPGSDVSLQIQADPRSLCGLRVVDQSVVLMKPEKELTADQIHNLFPTDEAGGYDYRVREYERTCRPEYHDYISHSFVPLYERRPFSRSSRSLMIPHSPDDEVDVLSLFKDMRIKILTDIDIQKPLKCREIYPKLRIVGSGFPGLPGPTRRFSLKGSMPPVLHAMPTRVNNFQPENIIPEPPPKAEIVRTYFPETWLWELQPTGDSGSVELHEKAPDTITDWNAGAFCMGPSGFGLSSPESLRVFQPFFVALTLPYSVVRGESFTLKATVFNYLKDCIKVQPTLGPSEELDEEPCADCPRTSCLCADESKTFYWNLKATKLGDVNITLRTEALDTQDLCHNELPIVPKQGSIDTVIKPLLVQPGGVLEEKAYSSLLCVQKDGGQSKQEVVSLTLPKNVLVDSERAYITVLGDLMGTAMQNLDRLLAMPYGCGEQNMVLFAPNICILQYLEKTHQLNEEILRKAKMFLQSGYQRQLTYKRDDGSYSAFGKSDKEGNTWLTAFVVKSFNKGRPYIFIDQTHLDHSFTWLKNHRHPNGCFRSVGKLFNTALKGGVDDEASLSAYVTAALIEAGVPLEDPLVGDALSCLKEAAVNVSNMYTQALLAYTFALAGKTEILKNLLEKLEKQAVRKDGQLHWERPSTKPTSGLPFWHRAPSAEVELTSYMLLTELSGPEKDLGRASEMVNWLSKQQNPYGGFSSTQDTVVALQALAQYAEATFSDAGDVTVSVLSETGVQEFHVDNTNRLLLQKMPLPDIPGDYTLSATGSGCVYIQTVLRYNIPPPSSDATFVIRVEVKPDECSGESVTKLQLNIYTEYTGSREKSNMALIEIKMLSGFIPVKSSVRELEKSKVIQRSEISPDMVTLYLDEVTHKALHLSLSIEQDIEVKNLKPATVKVYDYYETGEHAITEYNSPCSAEKKTNS